MLTSFKRDFKVNVDKRQCFSRHCDMFLEAASFSNTMLRKLNGNLLVTETLSNIKFYLAPNMDSRLFNASIRKMSRVRYNGYNGKNAP